MRLPAHLPLLALLLSTTSAIGCAGNVALEEEHAHESEFEEEDVGSTSSALTATSPVSSAVTQSCSTTAVKGLATQLVEEILCLKPGSMKKISGTAGLSLGAAVFPYLQTPAADALVAAQKARGTTMSINSGLRTLPQQYLLYRWYQTGRCGIGLAAAPGRSNHESGIAVDINDNAGWRASMSAKKYRWLGANDPVHFDFTGPGSFDMRGLSVKAFQRLWNRNNPTDAIDEDGIYGPATASRLANAPVGGFAKGALCSAGGAPAVDDEPLPPIDEVPEVPDATEPESATEASGPSAESTGASLDDPTADLPADAAGGCALARSPGASGGTAGLFAVALASIAARRFRRRRA